MIGHTVEIAASEAVDVARLCADSQRLAPALEAQGTRFLSDWLAELAT